MAFAPGAATVILLSVNAAWIFSSRLQGEGPDYIYASVLPGLSVTTLEDNALLVGAIASFLAVGSCNVFHSKN
jgi:inner membrane protein